MFVIEKNVCIHICTLINRSIELYAYYIHRMEFTDTNRADAKEIQ